jgi:tetratricopeptide (TPR) repeat protein
VSGCDVVQVQEALTELVRRQVLEILADPLSPQRGTFRFAHEMLRQVAYDTLSRHDRKSRHLAVAEHLRSTFANDGEEVVDVIARHYLDALQAVPDAADADTTRGRAVDELTRAGDRANRTGAKARAAEQFAHAAQLHAVTESPGAGESAAQLWEKASQAALDDADWNSAVTFADRAKDEYERLGRARLAARTQIVAATALRRRGQNAEAGQRLGAALAALLEDPDTDTVRALAQQATLAGLTDREEGGRLAEESLRLGQALGVGPAILSGLFVARGISLGRVNRLAEAAAYFREGARLGEEAGDAALQGVALVNLADALNARDPAAAVAAAQAAALVLRRAGNRWILAFATENLVMALLSAGEWDAVKTRIDEAVDDGLGDVEILGAVRAWLEALRGRLDSARAVLSGLTDLRVSEDPQDRGIQLMIRAFIAYAEQRTADALDLSRQVLDLVPNVGIANDLTRWVFPLATRCAAELDDAAEVARLLALLETYNPGEIPPVIDSDRDLARARLAVRNGDPDADERFAASIVALRTRGTPYHYAYGLLDCARYLRSTNRQDESVAFIDEAQEIAERLHAEPLILRLAALAGPSQRLVST